MNNQTTWKRAHISDELVIIACQLRANLGGKIFVDDLLHIITGAPLKVIRAAMQRTSDRWYIECGVSLRTSWVTDSGEALIANRIAWCLNRR